MVSVGATSSLIYCGWCGVTLNATLNDCYMNLTAGQLPITHTFGLNTVLDAPLHPELVTVLHVHLQLSCFLEIYDRLSFLFL